MPQSEIDKEKIAQEIADEIGEHPGSDFTTYNAALGFINRYQSMMNPQPSMANAMHYIDEGSVMLEIAKNGDTEMSHMVRVRNLVSKKLAPQVEVAIN